MPRASVPFESGCTGREADILIQELPGAVTAAMCEGLNKY